MLAQASSKRLAMGWPGVQPAVVSIAGEGVAQVIAIGHRSGQVSKVLAMVGVVRKRLRRLLARLVDGVVDGGYLS